MTSRRSLIVAPLVVALASPAAAQPAPEPEHPITAAQRAAAINQLATTLEQHYVFPDQAKAVSQALRAHLAQGDYNAHTTGEQLARAVTSEVVALAHDQHFQVRYVDGPPGGGGPGGGDGRPTAKAGEKVAAAMQLLGDTAGLIVDLRDCHGGDTETVTLAESYLVPAKLHLLDLYTRDDGKTEHVYAAAELAGPRYAADKPIFVLIGEATASGCEALAYTLQSQHRATVIGGHSAGAAHFGEPYKVTDHFMAFVANGRPVDPNTHGDWEGTGVIPTVPATKDKALEVGELQLLRVLAPRERSPGRQAAMQKRIAELSKQAAQARNRAG
jgi:hypothetical protein